MSAANQRNRVSLATPTAEGENEFLDAVFGSETLHHPWVFPPRTHEQYLGYLERIRNGRTIANLIRLTTGNRLGGVINVSEPVMGIFQSAYLGFYAFAGCEHQGLMTEGLALVLDRAFNELGFHRLEANIQPANYGIGGPCTEAWFPQGRLLSEIPVHRRRMARSRPLGDPERRVA